MKKTTLTFSISLLFFLNTWAQNPYQVNTSATNIKATIPELWVQPLHYNTLKAGLRFMVLPEVKGSAYELNFKTKTGDKALLIKDFGGKIFVYKKLEDIKQYNGDIKRRYYFNCEGKEYFLDEYKPDNENKIINWNEPSIIWLDEIDAVKKKLEGKTVWITASSWKYELNGQKVNKDKTERFAKVTVLQVGAGSYSNYPVRVLFRHEKDQKKYFVDGCVSGTLGSCFASENLHKMFSFVPPETLQPAVRKEFIAAIKSTEVKSGMNEAECYLSLGDPNNRKTYIKGKDKFVSLGYKPTDIKPYYLNILLKNDKVTEINKSE